MDLSPQSTKLSSHELLPFYTNIPLPFFISPAVGVFLPTFSLELEATGFFAERFEEETCIKKYVLHVQWSMEIEFTWVRWARTLNHACHLLW